MLPRQIKVKNLGQGMHARIRPSTSVDPNQPAGHFTEASLNHILNAPPPDLTLPSRKGRTIIRTDDLPADRMERAQHAC
jgi:hypothetical protein